MIVFTKISTLLYLFRKAGSGKKIMDQVNSWTRYCVVDELNKMGLMDYLREPHTFTEIRDRFELREEDFSTDVLVALANDRDHVLIFEEGKYRLDTNKPLPTLEEMQRTLPEKVLHLHVSHDLAAQIPLRMRGEVSELAHRLETERSQLMNFDEALGSEIYDISRECIARWARPRLGNTDGKSLLDVGCGSGREVAHLWTLFNGKVKITAVDPVMPFVEMGRERFNALLAEIGSGTRLTVTDETMPKFFMMGATELDFPDNSFDMVFHSGMLHWTPDPHKAIAEMIRVLKPGGVLMGLASHRPQASAFQNLTMRINHNVYGFPWFEDVVKWHEDCGVEFEHLVSGLYRAIKKS